MFLARDTINTNATSGIDLVRFAPLLVLLRVAFTLAIRTRSKLNRCETTSRRWFSLIRFKSLIRITWCSVNGRMGAKPVSLRTKIASVNGVIMSFLITRHAARELWHSASDLFSTVNTSTGGF